MIAPPAIRLYNVNKGRRSGRREYVSRCTFGIVFWLTYKKILKSQSHRRIHATPKLDRVDLARQIVPEEVCKIEVVDLHRVVLIDMNLV
jgi:hypothetical protein